jgi:2-keto-4-pentenoate hydratase/2-oxohepta-3-ene-1,7-dioic acid hydratase in catechol pathway
MTFQRLVRFVNAQGAIHFGDLKSEPTGDLKGAEVEVLEGDVENGFRGTGRTDKIEELLSPLAKVPLVICIGLNYQKHATEANVWPPESSCPRTRGIADTRAHSSVSRRTQSSSPSQPTLWLARLTMCPSIPTRKACSTTKAS